MARRNYFGEILSLIPKNSARGRRMKAEQEMMRTGVMRDTPIVQEVFRAGTSKDFPNQVKSSFNRTRQAKALSVERAKEKKLQDWIKREDKRLETRRLLSAFDPRPSYNVPTRSELREQLMSRRDFAGVKRLEQLAEKERRNRAQAVDTGMSYDVKPMARNNPSMRVSQSQTPLNPIQPRRKQKPFDPEDEPNQVPFANVSPYASPVNNKRTPNPYSMRQRLKQNLKWKRLTNSYIPVDFQTPLDIDAIASKKKRNNQKINWRTQKSPVSRTSMIDPEDELRGVDTGMLFGPVPTRQYYQDGIQLSNARFLDPEREIPRYSTSSSTKNTDVNVFSNEEERRRRKAERAMRRAEMRASYDVMPDESMNVYRRSNAKKRMTKGSSMSKRQAGPKPNKYF